MKFKYPLIAIAGMLSCLTAFAQQRKPFIPRTIDWAYSIVQGDSLHPYKKYIFAVPIIAYKPETKWIFGVSIAHIFRDKNNDGITRPSTIRLNLSYSQLNQFSIRPFIEYFSKANKYNVRAQGGYTDFAEYYWGIGNQVPESNKELYSFQMQKYNLRIARMVRNKLYAGFIVNYERMYNVHLDTASQMSRLAIRGKNGYEALGVGINVYFDNRDNIYSTLNGHVADFSAIQYGLNGASGFMNLNLDIRWFKQLWNENVLAMQLNSNSNTGPAPFRMLGTIGSEMIMRGYYNGRYRDQHAIAVQAELRKTIWGPVGCVFFAGAGNVGSNPGELFSNIKPNLGLGLRVKAIPREHLNARADFGFGNNGISAFYLTLNEAF